MPANTPDVIRSAYTRPDNRVRVVAQWNRRPDSALYLGEIRILTATHVMHVSSISPEVTLTGYATDDYLTRLAARLQVRP